MSMDPQDELPLNVRIAPRLDTEIEKLKLDTGQPKKVLVAWACYEFLKRSPDLTLAELRNLRLEYDDWSNGAASKTEGRDAAKPKRKKSA